ncbi:D-2-hydroxyacid dehydrogenase [Williamsia deligens]|uniref:D-2-hydroxyacid dehydrogenase n=1 Tax=Williamsia deligens TaxID=321325 RepID=A0ABW3G4M2_9NOCA|nr:D-2-hydroxyacid dehydrogenase [Williamsia deligens]MCP2194252.1 Phosphoglycerate dehydrogenase [Williamsia deligens]
MTVQPVRLTVLTRDDLAPPHNLDAIRELADVRLTTAADLSRDLQGSDALLLWDYFSSALRDAWDGADALRWVHVCAAGVDAMLFDGLRASDVTVTNARGVFDGPIAEFVLASILARDKQLHRSRALQRDHVWEWRETRRTTGSTALVVGTGGIGRAVARLLRAVGIAVTGAGRTARDEDPDFGTVVSTDDLVDHVADADTVVLIAPLTEQTAGLVDARVLAAMKPDAHLINVGRGALVVESDLVDALRDGTIGAASLDVVDTEPLPGDSPLWDMDQVAISPHMSGDVVGWRDELADQFLVRLRAYAAGDELQGAVDKDRGYVH